MGEHFRHIHCVGQLDVDMTKWNVRRLVPCPRFIRMLNLVLYHHRLLLEYTDASCLWNLLFQIKEVSSYNWIIVWYIGTLWPLKKFPATLIAKMSTKFHSLCPRLIHIRNLVITFGKSFVLDNGNFATISCNCGPFRVIIWSFISFIAFINDVFNFINVFLFTELKNLIKYIQKAIDLT